ncbi:MAG: lytic transglycosylase domain-containing protein [Bryobacteraceae bacterium]|jgi:soluble lytic murein transglycosylase-like protein
MCGFAAAVLQGAGAPAVSVVKADPRTGRLVRTVIRTQPAAAIAPSARLTETVDRIARQNDLSPRLVHSVIQVESNYDPNAVSPKGAQGLMQLIPSTARRFGVSDIFDPADNIQGGARYLKYLLELYKGDEALALAAYNAGEGAVSRYGGVPPFPETQDYVAKVRQRLAATPTPNETGVAPSAVQSNGAAETVPAEAYNPIREVVDANGKVYYISH